MQTSRGLEKYRHLIPLYGDIPLFMGLFKGEGWVRQYQIWVKGDAAAILLGIKSLVGFFISVFAFPVRVFLRYWHGIQTIGWFLASYTALTIIFFNWMAKEYKWTPLYTLWYPFRESWTSFFHPEKPLWWPDMMTNIYSQNLWWFCLVFCALSFIHILVSYFTDQSGEKKIRRGISIFWKIAALINKRFYDKDELIVWTLLETVLFGGIGAYLFYNFLDTTLGLFLMYSAACHFALEIYEFIGLRRYISR